MEQLKLLELQKILQKNGVLINFSGRFTQTIIEELGDAVKIYLETELRSQNATYNAFCVFIEQTQNIKNYGAQLPDGAIKEKIENSGIVAIGRSATGYFVSSGNIILNADAEALRRRLDELATLDKIALKKRYKEEMRREISPGSSGAGIGFIDMARRASAPLKYEIEAIGQEMSFFTMKVYI